MIQSLQTAPMQAPAQEPRFLKENWKVLLGTDCPDDLRYVRVQAGVANITNSHVLLRTPLPSLADGFYVVTEYGQLVSSAGSMPPWMAYPDVEACKPDFQMLVPSPPIPNEAIRELVAFAEYVRRKEKQTYNNKPMIVMTREGFYSAADLNATFALPLQNVVGGNETKFCPHQLKMVLTEMLRYPEVYFLKGPAEKSPLIVGRDWNHCALVRPLSSGSGYTVATRYGGGIHYNQ
jgi:hypothetical protein